MITYRKKIVSSVLSVVFVFGVHTSQSAEQPAPAFTQVVVFGDSLSDTGNVRDRTGARSGGLVDYPSHTFNYSNGRFTNDAETDPPAMLYFGVWHEQLAQTFLGVPPATYSLGGGVNYAFGGATTEDGTHEEVAVSTPFGDITITVDDMGKQMDDYLGSHVIDPGALYIVWGGANDLRNDDTAANVTATAARATMLVSRLATAGAQYIMVPNLPPLGAIPRYSDDLARISSLDTASANYRDELEANLTALMAMLAQQGFAPTLYRPDVWTDTIRIFSDPSQFGFTNTTGSAQDNSNVNPDTFVFWDDVHPTTAGHYWIGQNAFDSVTVMPEPLSKSLNISTRLFVGTGEQVSIIGFFISGEGSKRVLLRGLGPSLVGKGVPDPLSDPGMVLADAAGNPLASNENWRDTQAAEIMATGIPPQNDFESAIVATLEPGHYTVVLAGRDGGTGNGLLELYDLESDSTSTLSNLSTRGFVGTGDNVMIGGVIIGSGESPIMVLRAIGPSLAGMGIANSLPDPTLELHDINGALISTNDDWQSAQTQAVSATQLAPTDERESVIVAAFLTPGNYTAVVRGKAGASGVALVEAYRIQ